MLSLNASFLGIDINSLKPTLLSFIGIVSVIQQARKQFEILSVLPEIYSTNFRQLYT